MRTGIQAVLFDFGGVVAEEGFAAGLREIAAKNGLDGEAFFRLADALIYETGYLTGRADERSYWQALRDRTGIRAPDEDLRREILQRFVTRSAMVRLVDRIRGHGTMTALLSDQTNWLEELDRSSGLFRHFDRVFNSYRINMSKREASTFGMVAGLLGRLPGELLFVDDNSGHIERAKAAGYHTVLFTTESACEREVLRMTGAA